MIKFPLERYRGLPLKARIIVGVSAAVAVYLGTIATLVPVMDHVALNGTSSVPAHVLWKTPNRPILRGDFVLAPAHDPMIPKDYHYLTKYALCVEGDMLTERNGAFFCNGDLIHRAKRRTRLGAPLKAFSWPGGPVPKGMMFIGSRHPDGFDSRYLGLFRTKELIRAEKVL